MNNGIAIVDGSVVEKLSAMMPKILSRLEEIESENRQLKSGLKLWSAEELANLWCLDVQTVRKHLKTEGINAVVLSDRRATRYKDVDIRKYINKKTEKPAKLKI